MTAIDRVMRAFLKNRDLTEAQVATVRRELLKFIEELKQRPNAAPSPSRSRESEPG
jgi:hypothetical protein